jgi:hypothetical protein
MLKIACAFERGDAVEVGAGCEVIGILTPEQIANMGMRATAWTREF